MRKNDAGSQQDYEKLLKEKMDELSSSVDCFDKISARAFPENDLDFSDCGSTVSDLEIITGKRKTIPVIKWVAAAAAVVLCISIVPKTAFFSDLINDRQQSCTKRSFGDIVEEIIEETDSPDYITYDVPLDYYIKNDVLITPLFDCPFEDEESEDSRARIFIKTHSGVKTNQVYAVKYQNEYKEENFLAAACSGVKFTDDELAYFTDNTVTVFSGTGSNRLEAAVSNNFSVSSDYKLINQDNKKISAASFTALTYYKDNENIYPLVSDILYYHMEHEYEKDSTLCFYDIYSYYYDENGETEYTLPSGAWADSVNSDNMPEKPKESDSNFFKKDLFSADDKESLSKNIKICTNIPLLRDPQPRTVSGTRENEKYTLKYIYDYDENIIGSPDLSIPTPYDNSCCNTLRMYFAPPAYTFSHIGVVINDIYTENINYTYIGQNEDESLIKEQIENLESISTSLSTYLNGDLTDEEKRNMTYEHDALLHEKFELNNKLNLLQLQD